MLRTLATRLRPLSSAWPTTLLPPTTSLSNHHLTSPAIALAGGRRLLTITAQPPRVAPEEPLEGDAIMDLTDSAMAQIARAQERANNPDLALRVAVESGGCHGYQYKMEVTSTVEDEDYLFKPPTSPARLVVDPSSLALLSGSTIDYATELIGSSFRIKGNPHASDKGGCGCGVSWELKE